MDLIFGYLAGLLTLIIPCVLPVLPIVLAQVLAARMQAENLRLWRLGLPRERSRVCLALKLQVRDIPHPTPPDQTETSCQ